MIETVPTTRVRVSLNVIRHSQNLYGVDQNDKYLHEGSL